MIRGFSENLPASLHPHRKRLGKVLSENVWFVMLLFAHGSYNIFNDAMAAVLKMMDNNFSAEFQETEAYKNLEKVVEEEAEELERLRRVRCKYKLYSRSIFVKTRPPLPVPEYASSILNPTRFLHYLHFNLSW